MSLDGPKMNLNEPKCAYGYIHTYIHTSPSYGCIHTSPRYGYIHTYIHHLDAAFAYMSA